MSSKILPIFTRCRNIKRNNAFYLIWDILCKNFFPAEAIGGQSALKAIGGPLPNVKFCPTGGITIDNAKGYLELKNTLCVGGSWITPQRLIENKDWKSITALAKTASKIVFVLIIPLEM